MSEPQLENTNKRKRKKTFLKNAKKYGKRGYFGRGSQLDEVTYNYFVDTMETFREGFDSEQERAAYVRSIFERIKDEDINCCRNQLGSRVIETLLPFANTPVLERYVDAFSSDLRPLCSDRFASHVLEALIKKSGQIYFHSTESQEIKDQYKTFILKVSKFLLNNLEDYMWDQYGNNVFRTCLACISQVTMEEKAGGQPQSTSIDIPISEIPGDFRDVVTDCGDRILTWPQFKELCCAELPSGFLQVLCTVIHKVEPNLLKKYVKKIFQEFPENADDVNLAETIPSVFMSMPQVMLLETLLLVASAKSYKKIYEHYFKGRLPKLAKTRMTNRSVQKMLTSCQDKEQFDGMFDELAEHFEEIIQAGHTGVILALGQTCKRLLTKQGMFLQSLLKGLDCMDPEERQSKLIICLSRFRSYEESMKQNNDNLQKEKLNLHGTLILQLLLEFNKPIKIVNSLLEMDTVELANLFSNTMGSHIVDSFVKSTYIGEKSREKLIRKMRGMYQTLAATKFGSRSFEALWNVAGLKYKTSIIDELAHKDGAWSNSQYGKIIAFKINLGLYKRNKESWKQSLNKVDVKEAFADMLK